VEANRRGGSAAAAGILYDDEEIVRLAQGPCVRMDARAVMRYNPGGAARGAAGEYEGRSVDL
jgi:hypothetical protein